MGPGAGLQLCAPGALSHDETMLRAATAWDCWCGSENPVYWALQFDNPKVLAKAEQQLDEEDRNLAQSRRHHPMVDGQRDA